jgi:hypothetical protein
MATINITQSQIFTVLKSFLDSIVLPGTLTFQGQVNRVSEPPETDYVVMWPIFRNRLATNIDSLIENLFVGSISGTVLIVTTINEGEIVIGNQISGANVAANTLVTALGTGTGGVGTYTVSVSQTIASEIMQSGQQQAQQSTEMVIQADIHGPNSAENAQIINTLFWDQAAFDNFKAASFEIAPLYSSDPKQMPFINGEQQYETRYILELRLQVNPIVGIPIQFATRLGPVDIIDVV